MLKPPPAPNQNNRNKKDFEIFTGKVLYREILRFPQARAERKVFSLPVTSPTLAPAFTRPLLPAGIMAVALFIFSLWLNTRHNDFPYSYHPDEGGKTGQIIGGIRNYHHPLLMLSATDIVSRLAFIKREPQPIVETGRWVTATFAAATVVALALLAWFHFGILVGWGAGLAVALQVDLFETAHYFKEDPTLLFGVALSLLAAHVWYRFPHKRTLRFLAVACGLAVSGKYLGIVVLTFAIPIVLARRGSEADISRSQRLKLFAIAFGLTFLICNLPLFASKLSSPFRSIRNEVHGVAGGHRGITRQIPHGVYLETLEENAPRAVLVLSGVYALALVVTARRRTLPEWATLLFPLGYLAVISCSPKIADRYLLPVNVLLPFLAALGVAEIGRLIGPDKSRARHALNIGVIACLFTWLVASEWPTFHRSFRGYEHDDPTATAEWIKANLPATAVIAEDHRISLSPTKSDKIKNPKTGLPFEPSENARVPQKVYSPNFASELGTLEQLRQNGITHVAICKQSYGRYFKDETRPRESVKSGFDKQRDFYADILEEGQLVKEWPPGTISYLQPGIKLFQITRTTQESEAERR